MASIPVSHFGINRNAGNRLYWPKRNMRGAFPNGHSVPPSGSFASEVYRTEALLGFDRNKGKYYHLAMKFGRVGWSAPPLAREHNFSNLGR
jgi:hypothetical protein